MKNLLIKLIVITSNPLSYFLFIFGMCLLLLAVAAKDFEWGVIGALSWIVAVLIQVLVKQYNITHMAKLDLNDYL